MYESEVLFTSVDQRIQEKLTLLLRIVHTCMYMYKALAIVETPLYRTNNLWKNYVLNLLSLGEITTQYIQS